MHTCVRCGREAGSLEEINSGCTCGSKVFVFGQKALEGLRSVDPLSSTESPAPSEPPPKPSPLAQSQEPLSMEREKTAEEGKEGGAGAAPESYFARTTFSTEDVENIKIVSEGVFFVDVGGLSKNPVVLKDEEGVYYVRLPIFGNGDAPKPKVPNGKPNGKK